MKKKNLFMCVTSFQIMMAVSFRMTILKNESVDIVISDIIANSEKLFDNIRKSGVFDHAFYIKDYALNYKTFNENKFKTLKIFVNREKTINRLFPVDDVYDAFYATDTLTSIEWIYEKLLLKNSDLKLYYYEENPIWALYEYDQFRCYEDRSISLKGRVIDHVLQIHHLVGNYAGAYTSVLRQLPDAYFPWMDMPRIQACDMKKYISILNDFWGYKKTDIFNNKVVYLDQPYEVDGIESNDCDNKVLKVIMSIIDKERLIIKMHPRVRKNKYSEMGLQYYADSSVPWELFALNGDLDNSLVVSMFSVALINPQLYWSVAQSAVALCKCKEFYFSLLDEQGIYADVITKKKLAYLPQTEDDFVDILNNYKNGTLIKLK